MKRTLKDTEIILAVLIRGGLQLLKLNVIVVKWQLGNSLQLKNIFTNNYTCILLTYAW